MSVSVVPSVCWSVATSRSSGSVSILARIFGAHSLSSSRLASCSVYWNCVRVGRPPTRTSCAACRYRRAPSTLSSFGRSRAMICWALASRSSRGLRVMNRWPLLSARPPPPIAIADAGDGRVGLRRSWQASSALHLRQRKCPARLRKCGDQAVVLLREEALGDDDVQIDRQRQRREENRSASSAASAARHRGRAHRRAASHRSSARSIDRTARAGLRRAHAGSASPSSASASATPPSKRRSSWRASPRIRGTGGR